MSWKSQEEKYKKRIDAIKVEEEAFKKEGVKNEGAESEKRTKKMDLFREAVGEKRHYLVVWWKLVILLR